ncbi:MAG: hypothetical protein ABIF12_02440 [bacterium]
MKKILFLFLLIFGFFTINTSFCGNSNVRPVQQEELDVLFEFTNPFVGLTRSDNTCYANASLQLFMHSPRFYEFLLNKARLIDNDNYLLLLLKPLYSDYVESASCNESARIDLIRYIMSFNGQEPELNFGNFSSPNTFMDLFLKKLVPGIENLSLTENLKLFGMNVLRNQNYADAVILHVNGNHYVIKLRVANDLWVLIDEETVYDPLTDEQIIDIYSRNVIPVFFVKYDKSDMYLPLYEPIQDIISDTATLNILHKNNMFIVFDLGVFLRDPIFKMSGIGEIRRDKIVQALFPYIPLFEND